MAAIWTVGPWVPAVVCAATHLAAAEHAVAIPDCHGHAEEAAADSSAPAQPASGCCSDLADGCCLEAAQIDGAPSFGKSFEAPVQLAVVAVLPVLRSPVPVFTALPVANERARGSTRMPCPIPLRI